jgi:hypothetical protein
MERGVGSMDHDHDHDHDHDTQSGIALTVGAGINRPIGVSPALRKQPKEDWFRGEFILTKDPQEIRWNSQEIWDDLNKILKQGEANRTAELQELIELIEYRPGVMTEALAQRENPWSYYRGLFMSDAWSAPYTRDLLEIALRIGQFVVMHYKRAFNRARPSQYTPVLLPPVDVPGHASFPSGHATEAYLISACLAQVMPLHPHEDPPVLPPDTSPLQKLAERIARNREVLGLHYPSDSAAGKALAERSFGILMQCKTIKGDAGANPPQEGLLEKARKEWRR